MLTTPRHLFLAACCSLLAVSAQAADELPTPVLFGALKGDRYTAPNAIYSVSVPVLPELGGVISDTENVVTFDDSVSTHISLASFQLDMSQRWDLGEKGRRDYLTEFYVNYVLPDFQNRYPGSKAETTIFLPDLQEGAVIGFTLLPGGSAFDRQLKVPGSPAEPPPVAKRGNLLFARGDRIYIVSMELAERVTQRKYFNKTPEEEDAILRERLIQFLTRVRFPTPKPVRKQ